MSTSGTALFSELGFSRELYDIRQKNGLYLLTAAWILEVIAAAIGLLIAIILILQGRETLIEISGEITTSMQYSVYISGLPFIMSAVVELMKIPIVTLVYHSQSLLWKLLFTFALCALAFVTFETMLAGMQQSYQVRTGAIQDLTQRLAQATEERDNLEQSVIDAISIDTSDLDARRAEAEEALSSARTAATNRAQNEINELRGRLGEGSTGTAQAQLDRLTAERNNAAQELETELNQNEAQYQNTVERLETLYDGSLASLAAEEQSAVDIYNTEVTNCQGIFTTGSCQNEAEETRDARIDSIRDSRESAEERNAAELDQADNDRLTRATEIRERFQQRIDDLDQRIEEASRTLNTARNIDVTELQNMIREVEARRDQEIAEVSERFRDRIDAINTQIEMISEPSNPERMTDIRTQIEETESRINDIAMQLDDESANSQIYQIAKLAMSVCFAIPDDQCLANSESGDGEFRYSDLPQEYVEKISIYWFGSLALIMSTIGILLAFGAMVLKYEHIDEHSAFKRGLKTIGRNISELWSEIISAIRYVFSLFTYLTKILKSIRSYFVYRAKHFAKEPLIQENEKIVEKVVEVPVEKVITKEVVKEVPVEKVVVKTVEKPIPMKSKEFVYVPFYSDDPKDREKFEERMTSLGLNNPSQDEEIDE